MVSQRQADLHAKALASSYPGRHSESPEPITASGVLSGNAMYDPPAPGVDPATIVSGPRKRKSTERGEVQANSIRKRNERSTQWHRSKTVNDAMRAASQERPSAGSQSGTVRGRQTDIRPLGQPNSSTGQPQPPLDPKQTKSQSQLRVRIRTTNTQANETQLAKKQQANLKLIQRSPSLGSSDVDPIDILGSESQYTYIYEDVGYETLAGYAEARLGYSVAGWTEDQIVAKLDIQENYQAPAMATPRVSSSVIVLSPTPIAVGGGWHREHEYTSGSKNSDPRKRPPQEALGKLPTKRICAVNPNNTDTESESDDEVIVSHPGPPPAPPAPPPVAPIVQEGEMISTPLTRIPTATTVLDGQTTNSPSLGGPEITRFSPLPCLLSPFNYPHRPVHARLQGRLADRALQRLTADDPGQEDTEMDELAPTAQTARSTAQITYVGYRSHANSQNDTQNLRHSSVDRPQAPVPTQDESQPNTKSRRHPSNSVLAHLERTQAVDAVQDSILASRAEAATCSRIRPRRTKPSAPPKYSTQQSSVQQSSGPSCSSKNTSHRLDPMSAARADMIDFNKRCTQDNVLTFVQTATRQNKRTGRSALREGEVRSLNELLRDNKEDLAHDEALQAGSQPTGRRKKKPLARDFHGITRQVLTLAKFHLFAFVLSEGVYQTRVTFLMWASLVHEATWNMELADVPYVAASQEELEVMVNYIATLRGKIKERIRPIVSHAESFDHCVATQEDIQANLDIFHKCHPNSFHCTSRRPRKGHYENIILARCIAAAFFYGPNSVGVLFPDYFEGMSLNIVAFILAMIQFCLEEWQDGYFVSRDLGAGNMLERYEGHLASLKNLRKVAPRRVERLQDGWFEYATEYAGATFIRSKDGQESFLDRDFRPDTPPPSPPRHEEPIEGSSSGGTSACAIEATSDTFEFELGVDGPYPAPSPGHDSNPFEVDFDPQRAETPPLPVTYNKHRCQTTQSKGKHCAQD